MLAELGAAGVLLKRLELPPESALSLNKLLPPALATATFLATTAGLMPVAPTVDWSVLSLVELTLITDFVGTTPTFAGGWTTTLLGGLTVLENNEGVKSLSKNREELLVVTIWGRTMRGTWLLITLLGTVVSTITAGAGISVDIGLGLAATTG